MPASYANQACVDDGAGGAAQRATTRRRPSQNPHLAITKVATEASFDAVGR